ncbi:MAG: NAD(P)-binding domain-containing protein [Planctomycetota bacterium]
MTSHRTPVVIVGAGPIGIELAVAFRREDIPFELLDAGCVGHTMSWWAPQTRWFSSNERIAIAGIPLLTVDQGKATREEYLTYLRSVLSQHRISVRTHSKVTEICRSRDGFELRYESSGVSHPMRASAVVLAIGGTDFPNRLQIPGDDLPHVDGYLRETHRYYGRRVLVIGGRNSAVEAALRLHHAGATVALSYRGERLPEKSIKYWLWPEINGLINAGRIKAYFSSRPVEITSTEVILQDDDGRRARVATDDVLALIGYAQDKSLFRSAGVTLSGPQEVPSFDPATMETDVPDLYVAGTAIAGTQSSKYRIFLENCHEHVDRIVAAVTGKRPASAEPAYQSQVAAQPES